MGNSKRAWVVIASIVLAGCSKAHPPAEAVPVAAASEFSPPSPAPQPVAPAPDEPPAPTYPFRYPAIPYAKREARRAEVEARSPGWTITIDDRGGMMSASCSSCVKKAPGAAAFTPEERAKIDQFVSANRDVLGLDEPFVVKKIDTPSRIFYQQLTPWEVASFVAIDALSGTLTIRGSMWRKLPAPGPALGERVLDQTLRALDPAAGLTVKRYYLRSFKREEVVLREAVCLVKEADNPDPMHVGTKAPSEPAKHPCIDARTGERLTDFSPWVQTTPGSPP